MDTFFVFILVIYCGLVFRALSFHLLLKYGIFIFISSIKVLQFQLTVLYIISFSCSKQFFASTV